MKQIKTEHEIVSYRNDVLQFASKQYQTVPEYLWKTVPHYAVLRHSDNRKWYGILMDVPRERLGLSGSGIIDILDVKCDPILGGSLRLSSGFLPAYHMNHEGWITILLDGTVDKEQIFSLLEMSFELTASRSGKRLQCKKDWIVPANPKYYNLEKAFSEHDIILWKQSNHISVGDTVYLYITAPVSAICYKCEAVEVDIPYDYDDGNVHMNRVMRLKLLESFEPTQITFDRLKEHGIFAIRGPRKMPDSLINEMKRRKEGNRNYEQ